MPSDPIGAPITAPPMGAPPVVAPTSGSDADEIRRKLELPIAAMDLSVRASNCLEAEGIQTMADLVSRTQDELMALKNFGRTSLKEISKKLDEMNLSLGMDVEAIQRS